MSEKWTKEKYKEMCRGIASDMAAEGTDEYEMMIECADDMIIEEPALLSFIIKELGATTKQGAKERLANDMLRG